LYDARSAFDRRLYMTGQALVQTSPFRYSPILIQKYAAPGLEDATFLLVNGKNRCNKIYAS